MISLRPPASWAILILAGLLFSVPVEAKTRQSSASGFLVEHTIAATAAPADVYRAIGQIDRWWDSKHTFSGNAANLKLEAKAGGCFCETWSDGSVEHGRVVQTQRDQLVRLHTALGPMLEMAVSGVLTFSIKPATKGSTLLVSYRVSGDASHAFTALAPVVDRVIGEQAQRLGRFADTGKPE